MPNNALDEAIREAYASAPDNEIIFHTLELRHPEFKDDQGNVVTIRVVRNYEEEQAWRDKNSAEVDAVLDGLDDETRAQVGLVARLEADAPVDPGAMVYFTAFAFDLVEPPVDIHPSPEAVLEMDNVGKEVLKHLEAAAKSKLDTVVTYRSYLLTDIEGPQEDPPLEMTLSDAKANPIRVAGRIRVADMGNKSFPRLKYTSKKFPGLAR